MQTQWQLQKTLELTLSFRVSLQTRPGPYTRASVIRWAFLEGKNLGWGCSLHVRQTPKKLTGEVPYCLYAQQLKKTSHLLNPKILQFLSYAVCLTMFGPLLFLKISPLGFSHSSFSISLYNNFSFSSFLLSSLPIPQYYVLGPHLSALSSLFPYFWHLFRWFHWKNIYTTSFCFEHSLFAKHCLDCS